MQLGGCAYDIADGTTLEGDIIKFHPADTNNEHLLTSMVCQEDIRLFQRGSEMKPIQESWFMEVPSCTEWALNTAMKRFQPNTWVEVGKEGVDAKVKATFAKCVCMTGW